MSKLTKGKIFLLWLFLVIAHTSCMQNPQEAIVGAWNVSAITSEKALPNYNLTEFHFDFFPDDSYIYSGNLYYREAGRFAVKSGYLYTTDTLNRASTEKAVQIIKLSRDSLVLRMANETIMRMVRQKEK